MTIEVGFTRQDADVLVGLRGLRSAHEEAREAVSDVADLRSSTASLRRMRVEVAHYLRRERAVFDLLSDSGDPGPLGQLEAQHARLVAAYNAVLWETPGTAEMRSSAFRLRHLLLRQLELVQQQERHLQRHEHRPG